MSPTSEKDLARRRKRLIDAGASVADSVTGMVAGDTREHDAHRCCTGRLLKQPSEAARYAELKHQLTPLLSADRSAYTAGKARLITELLTHAREGSS